MAILTLPQPEAIPAPDRSFAPRGFATTEAMKALRGRAERVIARAYGPRLQEPHGWYQRDAFVANRRRNDALTRAYKLAVRRLVDRALRTGQLELASVDTARTLDWVRLPGDDGCPFTRFCPDTWRAVPCPKFGRAARAAA